MLLWSSRSQPQELYIKSYYPVPLTLVVPLPFDSKPSNAVVRTSNCQTLSKRLLFLLHILFPTSLLLFSRRKLIQSEYPGSKDKIRVISEVWGGSSSSKARLFFREQQFEPIIQYPILQLLSGSAKRRSLDWSRMQAHTIRPIKKQNLSLASTSFLTSQKYPQWHARRNCLPAQIALSLTQNPPYLISLGFLLP